MLLPIIASIGLMATALFTESKQRPQKPAQEIFGVAPPPPMASAPAASVLRSAALAGSGSWTRRNVLAQGAQSSWQRRIAGNATEADFAVLRAAQPGIASSRSGHISPGWSGSPWPGEPDELGESGLDAIAEAVAEQFSGNEHHPMSGWTVFSEDLDGGDGSTLDVWFPVRVQILGQNGKYGWVSYFGAPASKGDTKHLYLAGHRPSGGTYIGEFKNVGFKSGAHQLQAI